MRRRAKLNSEPSEANDSKDSLHVAVQRGLEQRRQHFLSIREVAKEILLFELATHCFAEA